MGFGANYAGNPTAIEAPSPAPGPGVAPIVYVPSDLDGASWANIAQAIKTSPDFIAYLMKLLNGQLPVAPGGANADKPQLMPYANGASNPRWLVSHNGFPGGPINVFREQWMAGQNTSAAGLLINNPVWYMEYTNAGGAPSWQQGQVSGSLYAGTFSKLNLASTLNNAVLLSSTPIFNPACTFASWELKADFAMDTVGANNATFWVGLSGTSDYRTPGASGYLWFKKTSGVTNWQCEANDGASTTTQDSGVPPLAFGTGGMQRLRIEYHGSTTPYGANTARFFINDVLVKTYTTNLPITAQEIAVGGQLTTGGAARTGYIGTVELYVNRFSSGGGI